MRLLTLLFLLVYCVLPLSFYNITLHPLIYIFVVLTIVSFLIGSYTKLNRTSKTSNTSRYIYKPRIWALTFIFVFIIYYGSTVIDNDLMSRRHGTEALIKIFLELSLLDFLLIRVGDIVLPMLAILWIVFYKTNPNRFNFLILSLLFFSTISFTGYLDSRRNLILFLLFSLAATGNLSTQTIKTKKMYFVVLLIPIFIIIYTSLYRVGGSNNVFEEIANRLNGLKYMAILDRAQLLLATGSFDVEGYKYYISSLPFLEVAREYKLNGTTSFKGYILQDVLNLTQKDDIWSIIVDIGYVFGVFGTVILGYILGHISKIFDRNLIGLKYNIGISRNILTFNTTLLFTMTNIEGEFFANVIGFFKYYLLIGSLTWVLISRSTKKSAGGL